MSVRVQFKGLDGEAPGKVCQVLVATNLGLGAGTDAIIDPRPAQWEQAMSGRDALMSAIFDAIAEGRSYPEAVGLAMLRTLAWSDGFHPLQDRLREWLLEWEPGKSPPPPLSITFQVDSRLCALVPELCPVQCGNTVVWLDACAAIARTVLADEADYTPHGRIAGSKRLAILYQDLDCFYSLIEDPTAGVERQLRGKLTVKVFKGSELVGPLATRLKRLADIFFEHDAVLFIGQVRPAQQGPASGGWLLTERDADVLPMSELRNVLGVAASRSPTRPGEQRHAPMAQLVFVNGCASAAADSRTMALMGLSYPQVFLRAGARFFIGTSMEYVLREDRLPTTQQLLVEFFSRWAANPGNAPLHLYEAKRQCGVNGKPATGPAEFDLLTGLYQLYTAETPQRDVVTSALKPGSRLGDFELDSELNRTDYARTFLAVQRSTGNPCLVQVLADHWQTISALSEKLQSAIQSLKELRAAGHLTAGHLLPTAHQEVSLGSTADRPCPLHILIFELPIDVALSQLSEFVVTHGIESEVDYFEILRLGVSLSVSLAELHKQNLAHGHVHPGSLLWCQRKDARVLLLTNHWVSYVLPSRRPAVPFAPPEADSGDPTDRGKGDCWGLGMVLCQMATGQLPSDLTGRSEGGLTVSLREARHPSNVNCEALEAVVRDCLAPSAKLRPSAAEAAVRLRLALDFKGAQVGLFEGELDRHIQAGHRLFAIPVSEYDDLLETLRNLAGQPHRRLLSDRTDPQAEVHYRLYRMEEYRGLFDDRRKSTVVGWAEADEVHQENVRAAQSRGEEPPPFPEPPEVATYNANHMFKAFSMWQRTFSQSGQVVPVLLIRGNSWWDSGPSSSRVLRQVQLNPQSPVVFVADSVIDLDIELQRQFVIVQHPPLLPAILYDRIRKFAATENLTATTFSEETAALLTEGLFPCAWREAKEALRMCALKHGVLDLRALHLREEAREQYFRQLPGATYLRSERLIALEQVGLPDDVGIQVTQWLGQARLLNAFLRPLPLPRKLLISGPTGCGKTTLAMALAAAHQRPLVRVDASLCLRGELGESERALRSTLVTAASLRSIVVLLDDVDEFFGIETSKLGVEREMHGTLSRMSTLLLDWLDHLPPWVVVILTCENSKKLDPQWRRRVELTLNLPQPATSAAQPAEEALTYRAAIFSALLRRSGLLTVANNERFIAELARETDPLARTNPSPLRSPVARRARDSVLTTNLAVVRNGAEIRDWVETTLLLHSSEGDPETVEFWKTAI